MAVGVEREADLAVAERFHHDSRRDALGEEQRGARMCATAIVEAMRPLGVKIRAGVHTGEVERIGGKTGGLAVAIGARIAAATGPCEVLASQTVRDLTVGSGLRFEDAGEHELKGAPERWRLYRVGTA